jgi:hypothetical protein
MARTISFVLRKTSTLERNARTIFVYWDSDSILILLLFLKRGQSSHELLDISAICTAHKTRFGTRDSLLQPFSPEGFENIIHRVCFKRFDGIVTMSCHKDGDGNLFPFNRFDDLHSRQPRYLNIEKNEVGKFTADSLQSRYSVAAFPKNLYLAIGYINEEPRRLAVPALRLGSPDATASGP